MFNDNKLANKLNAKFSQGSHTVKFELSCGY